MAEFWRNQKPDWNGSLCNPFDDGNTTIECPNGTLPNPPPSIPETPKIINVMYPRVDPFAKVPALRTAIDNLHFEVYKFADRNGGYLGGNPDEVHTVYKYQAYLPDHWFESDGYYLLRTRASNKTGFSPWSAFYELDYVPQNVSDPKACYNTEVYYMDCDLGFCCEHIYVCT